MNRQEQTELGTSFLIFLSGLGLVTLVFLALLTIFSGYLGMLL